MDTVVPLAALVVSILLAVVGWQQALAQSRRQAEIEFRSAQLRQLYGPLQMQRKLSQANRSLLPEEDENHPEGRWRLVHHIGSIRKAWLQLQSGSQQSDESQGKYSEAQIKAVAAVIENGDQAVELIVKGGGLFESPKAESYGKYVEHHEHLKMSWLSEENQPYEKDDSYPYPGMSATASLEDLKKRLAEDGARDADLDCAIFADEQSTHAALEAARRGGKPAPKYIEWILSPTASGAIVLFAIVGLVVLATTSLSDSPDELDRAGLLVNHEGDVICVEVQGAGPVELDSDQVSAADFLAVIDSC